MSLSLQSIARDPDAQAAAVQQSVDSVLSWLSNAKHNWLLIFDNVEDRPGRVVQSLPTGSHGGVLFTSRNPAVQSVVSFGATAHVECLEEDAAITLLLKAALLDASRGDLRQAAKPIVSELCFVPLAIDQAGAMIGNKRCPFHEYLKLYTKHHAKLMSYPVFEEASMHGRAVYTTWNASYVQMELLALVIQMGPRQPGLPSFFCRFLHSCTMEALQRRYSEGQQKHPKSQMVFREWRNPNALQEFSSLTRMGCGIQCSSERVLKCYTHILSSR
jgi:hypothetical protein